MARWCVTQGATVSVADTRSENQLSDNAKKYQQQVKDLGVKNIHLGGLSSDLLSGVDLIAISPGLSP
ncbi:MAG: UDP-N-acetylmuramoyl-L-alanine--D-glutamate ligase, partial [Polynucleobacter victoriensis]